MMTEKHRKLLYWIDQFSEKELELITRSFSLKYVKDKKQLAIIVEMVWINLGRNYGTTKEIAESLHEVLVLMSLELFRRMKALKRDREGRYMKTEIGKEVLKMLNNPRCKV